MITDSKLYSKMLLKNNTARLFGISLLSLLLRTALVALVLSFSYFFLKSDFLAVFSHRTNKYFAYFLLLFIINAVRISAFLLIFGIKLGESFVYFKRASGEKGSFSLLFHFLTPKKAARAFLLYCTVTFYKVLWLLFYIFPSAVCTYTSLMLYKSTVLTTASFYALISGGALLLISGFVFFFITAFRYEASPYYMCLENIGAKRAIKKSAAFTDSALTLSLLFKISFSGWFFSCVLLLPIIYVVPYFKLSKARFIINAVYKSAAKEEKADFPIVLLPKKAT